MSLGGAMVRSRRLGVSTHLPDWSRPAWAAIAVAATFVALTTWWLTQDRSTPYADAAEQLWAAFRFRDYLLDGDIGAIFAYPAYYPPYGMVLGGLIAVAGGIARGTVVLGVNLVCVPLLALSCFRIGRRVAGEYAGALAVVFALGAPLLIELFHVFMIDAPEATVVALSVWLLLESERFERAGVAALAGLAVGVGIGTKPQFPLYLVGLVAVMLLRGGWRNMRGFAGFAGIALLVGAPWYIVQADVLPKLWSASRTGEGLLFPVPPLARPPLLSWANLEWYGWATLNGLLFAPLAAFAVVGIGAAIWRLRRRPAWRSDLPELLGGLAGTWLTLTLLLHRDMRYTLPAIVYLAVLGTAWVAALPRRPRLLGTTALGAAVLATTLGMTFGVGGAVPDRLPGNLGAALGVGVPPRDRVVVYSNHDYLVSGPRRDGDLLGLLEGLRRMGVRKVYWDASVGRVENQDFNGSGITVLARIAGLSVPRRIALDEILPRYALLLYQRSAPDLRACVEFDDGRGVYALIGRGMRAIPWCPGRGRIAEPIPVPTISEAEPGATSLP